MAVSNLAKFAGVMVFVNEAWIDGRGRPSVLAVCALLVLGAQGAENLILHIIDRLLTSEREPVEKR